MDGTDIRQRLDRAIAEGDAIAAQRALEELWRCESTVASAAFIVGRFEKIRPALAPPRLRVAILRSFAVEPVVPLLRASSAAAGLDVEVELGEFNAYVQDILDPDSRVFSQPPDVVVLAVRAEDVAPEISVDAADLEPGAAAAEVERLLGEYGGWLDALRRRTGAAVVVHDFGRSERPSGGILAAQAIDPVGEFNAGLRRLASERAGVYVLDYDRLVARHGQRRWHDPEKWWAMRMPIAAGCQIHLAQEWLRFLHPLAGKVCKVLVTDLDNTLWSGVIGEDGLDGIAVGPEPPGASYRQLQRTLLDLYRRGIILAIASKNNEADALAALREHPGMLLREEHFAALQIHWRDKAQSLRDIARELNVGIDSLAFLDDNPVERELVRTQVPEVTVLELPDDPADYARAVRDAPVFERLSLSGEDRERGRMYSEQRRRREAATAASSVEDFYRSLEMRAEVAPITPATLARAAQLTQKTNQFNLTTRRYSEREVEEMAGAAGVRTYSVRVEDRFGDNGVVGLMLVRAVGESWEIDTFLMSCRVIGRTVETAMLATLAADARRLGATSLVGLYRPTPKNEPARSFYPDHGFTGVEESDGAVRFTIDLREARIEAPPWIEIEVRGGAEA